MLVDLDRGDAGFCVIHSRKDCVAIRRSRLEKARSFPFDTWYPEDNECLPDTLADVEVEHAVSKHAPFIRCVAYYM